MTVAAAPRRRAAPAKPTPIECSSWGPAAPTRWTPPLSENFTTDADWFLPVITRAWSIANPGFELDNWQVELLRRVLETYPPGHSRAGQLRYRQVVISLARQNGKSVLGAILGIYGLIRDLASALVIGIASSAEQARIIYDRTNKLIAANPALKKRFSALTDTRGIRAKAGGKYEIKAAKAAALQGLAITLGVVDELHLLVADLWNALVSGTGGRDNALVVGITTAGDEDSALLIQLYEIGEKAISGDPDLTQFGFFVWEAPEARVPKTRATLIKYLEAANPSLAEGRIPVENVLADIAGLAESEIIRYRLNRFVSATTVFIGADMWMRCARGLDESFPTQLRPVISIDRTPDWGYATISATVRDEKGLTWTEVVASIVKPTLEQLVAVCVELAKHSPATFIMDGYSLKDLAIELKKRGLPVTVATQGDVINGSALTFAKVIQKKLRHASDPLLSIQMPRTVRKNVGENFRISRKDSSVEIDAVMSVVLGVHGAETKSDTPIQVF